MGGRFAIGLLMGAVAVSLLCTSSAGNEAVTQIGQSIKDKAKEALDEIKPQATSEGDRNGYDGDE